MYSFLNDTELYGAGMAGEQAARPAAARGPVQVGGPQKPPEPPEPRPAPPPVPPMTLIHYDVLLRALGSIERRLTALDERTAQLLERAASSKSGGASNVWCTTLICLLAVLFAVWLARPRAAAPNMLMPTQLTAYTQSSAAPPLAAGMYLPRNGGPPTPIFLAAAPTSFLQPS